MGPRRHSRRHPITDPRFVPPPPGQYRLQAAILACHTEAPRWEDTDWAQIIVLYDMLLHVAPSPIIRLHRTIALRYITGPAAALTELETLAPALERHHLYHATRAEMLRELGRPQQARLANQRALELTTNPAQRKLLEQRIKQPGKGSAGHHTSGVC